MEKIQESFTIQDVLTLLQAQSEENRKQMMDFARELKKPTEREQREIDDKDLKLKQHQETRLKLAKAEEDRKEMQKRTCQHGTMHSGTGILHHQWRAQVHTPAHCDAYFQPRCTQCATALDPIRATAEMLTQGVNLCDYKSINMQTLIDWAPLSWKGHEDRHPFQKAA